MLDSDFDPDFDKRTIRETERISGDHYKIRSVQNPPHQRPLPSDRDVEALRFPFRTVIIEPAVAGAFPATCGGEFSIYSIEEIRFGWLMTLIAIVRILFRFRYGFPIDR